MNQKKTNISITYIGGGSRGWAWNLMSDLAVEEDLQGVVTLFDIDQDAAEKNRIIGNSLKGADGVKGDFTYRTADSLRESLSGADFVVISILPGTFAEMDSDVHGPEKYGIYQSVGDTTGPGGILRALRTLPMYVEIAEAIRDVCPDAWVINYTNPMGPCVRILHTVFPKIKAFGCCHEVFGSQELLAHLAEREFEKEKINRDEIKINVQGVNHFTWIDSASYCGRDLLPLYAAAVEKHWENGLELGQENNWMNNHFSSANRVKFDLFRRYGVIAAAGDRHLSEFCPPWYLKDPDTVKRWKFSLTPVSWRKHNQAKLIQKSAALASGQERMELKISGEEGVRQIKALLGLGDFVTNVNLPNGGQISNVPLKIVVETNALFTQGKVIPLFSGAMTEDTLALSWPHIYSQKLMEDSCMNRSLEPAYRAFAQNPLVTTGIGDTKQLFDEMVKNTQEYLQYYTR